MKFLRSTVQKIAFDFYQKAYQLNDGNFDFVADLRKVVAKKQVKDGFLVGYQDVLDLLCRQELGNFDGEVLDETFNRACFCSFEEIESEKAGFFEPRTINAFIYLKENLNVRHLCFFNPSDFDEILEVPSKTDKKRKRVIVFENVSTIFNAKKPAFYLCGLETETKQGIERVWELWRDDERVECAHIVFTDLFYHNSFGDNWEICNWV